MDINPLTSPPSLSQEDRIEIFQIATRSLVYWHKEKFKDGMSDKELENALRQSLGIFGGSGGPHRLSVTFQGSGLKIWGVGMLSIMSVRLPYFKARQPLQWHENYMTLQILMRVN